MGETLRRPPIIAGAALAAFLAVGFLGPLAPFRTLAGYAVLGLAALLASAYIVWRTHPSWTLTAALLLSVFAGNWEQLGVPGFLAPDRILIVLTIAAVIVRAPPVRDRPALRFGAAHWAMIMLLTWTVGSALASETLSNRGELFEILERLGVLPFLIFLVAPLVFDTEERRRILLGALVALGAYLGITAALEAIGATGIVLPRYIADPNVGIHADRARGPFVEAVTNGAGLYAGVVGAGIGLTLWREPLQRLGLLAVLGLCGMGVLFTETRSVWLGATLATGTVLLFVPEIRRWLIPTLVGGAALFALSLALIPGLQEAVIERGNNQSTVYDRQNLATAAINIVEEKPLLGVGWGRFTTDSQDYFEQADNYPLSANRQVIHNVFLTYAAEIGLIGLGLWAVVLLLGVGGALVARVPRELAAWQVGLGAYALFFLVISNFVFAQVFPNNMIWLLAGLVTASATDPGTLRSGVTRKREEA